MLLTRRARRRGAHTIECAFIFPITFALLVGLVVFAMGVFRYQQMAYLAREAARYAAVHAGQYQLENAAAIAQGTLPDVTDAYIAKQVVQANAFSLDPCIRSRVEGDKRTEVIGSGRWWLRARGGVEWRAGRAEDDPSVAGNSCTHSCATSGQHSVEGTACTRPAAQVGWPRASTPQGVVGSEQARKLVAAGPFCCASLAVGPRDGRSSAAKRAGSGKPFHSGIFVAAVLTRT
jgi:hypothetical protein